MIILSLFLFSGCSLSENKLVQEIENFLSDENALANLKNDILDKVNIEMSKELETTVEANESSAESFTEETELEEDTQILTKEFLDSEEGSQYTFESLNAGKYAYNTLTETEKIWYNDINSSISHMQEETELSLEGLSVGLDENNIDKIFQCVLVDHPEYFYVQGYQYTTYTKADELVKITFIGNYNLSKEEAKKRQVQIEEKSAAILGGIAKEASEYEKVKYVYETIILQTEYDLNSSDNQNIYSVFVNQMSVCQGYAKSAQYLLNQLGIECVLVLGEVSSGEGHAWNLVKIEGKYYYIDTTWGDASYQVEENQNNEVSSRLPEINYDYLCVTTAQLSKTHKIGGVIAMPECNATSYNYYEVEGLLFTDYNPEQMAAVFERAAQEQREDVTVKCVSEEVYKMMKNKLIEEQEIFNYLNTSSGSIAYAENVKQLSLTFWMTN